MAKIVVCTAGSYGDLYPFLTVAKYLSARGYDVVLAASRSYQGTVIRAGISFAELRPDIPLDDPEVWIHPDGFRFLLTKYVMPAIHQGYHDLEEVAEGADLIISCFSNGGAGFLIFRRSPGFRPPLINYAERAEFIMLHCKTGGIDDSFRDR